jgi:hypothetical protein
MKVDFDHEKPVMLPIGDEMVPFKMPSSQTVTYSILMEMLPREEALGDFVHEDDHLTSILDENDMCIILYQRHDEKEPRALFCFEHDKHPKGEDFYWGVVTYIKEAYAEELI